MRFSDQLKHGAADLWEAQYDHPFVRGIRDGTLDPERFRFFVLQDYLFLIEYGRVLALACARAPRLELMKRFAVLAESTLGTEMDLHRAYAAEWGITPQALEQERPQPVTRGYSDFLLRTAALGDFGELMAALLPCMWGYSELGLRLAQSHPVTEGRYIQWIEMYAADDFAAQAHWCREICDEAAADFAEEGRRRMHDAFLASSRYELDFFEQAWRSKR
jgi:thiaminase (transcriptional activator TenA)